MPSLREQQQRFADALRAPRGTAPDVLAGPALGGRFDVYRRNGVATYRNALGASYPVVRRLIGLARFVGLVDAFTAAHPSRSGDLNVYGDRFPEFIAAERSLGELPYLADVARLEWSIDEAHRAEDGARVPEGVLAALATVPPEALPALRFALDPSCRFVASPYPVLRIWKTNQEGYAGDDRVDLAEGGDALLVRRDPAGVAIERIGTGDFAWLVALHDGATLGDAIEVAQRADPAFDLSLALRMQVGAGTLVRVLQG